MRLESYATIIFTFILALWLSIYPLPYALLYARPEWLTLVLIYWVIALPERVGVVIGWSLGILLDGFQGTLLGQNAFALAIVAYVSQRLYQRVRMYAVWQQALLIFVLIGLKQLLCHWVNSLSGGPSPDLRFLLPALTSALIWPAMMVLLRGVRRHMGMVKSI
jgi:rod shape-determining protein MreD